MSGFLHTAVQLKPNLDCSLEDLFTTALSRRRKPQGLNKTQQIDVLLSLIALFNVQSFKVAIILYIGTYVMINDRLYQFKISTHPNHWIRRTPQIT